MPAEPQRTLSEAESKELLSAFGLPFARELRAPDPEAALAAGLEIGFPVALKLNGDAIAHKTERGLVRLGLSDAESLKEAAGALLSQARPEDGPVDLLVAEMVSGQRELIVGLVRDPQFGACVLLGLGGVLTEALGALQNTPSEPETEDNQAQLQPLHEALEQLRAQQQALHQF